MLRRMLAAMVMGLIHGLAALLRLPVEIVARMMGVTTGPTAADVAEEAIAAVAATPKPSPFEPAVERKRCPVAELVAEHARKIVYFHEDRSHISPLPLALRTWVDGLTTKQLTDVIGADPERLQAHINAGLSGSTAPGPYGLPPVLPAIELTNRVAEREGRGGKGGGPARTMDLAELLQDAGYAPGLRPR